ncbi:hypothetical protein H9W95_00955 [Flavobacterium lindanitolerans]|nr:hypothetical protein [Flavobacterium lindanitolerans]
MDELNTKFFIGLSWHFGGGPKSYFSGTAGVGVSRRFGPVDPVLTSPSMPIMEVWERFQAVMP